MGSVSVIIPSRKERFLNNTIQEVFENFEEDFEIIVTLDGADAPRVAGVRYILNEEPKGMRTAINQAVAIARGDFIMKLDAHCMLDKGIDVKLKKVHQHNWVQIPTRKRLDAHRWELMETDRDDVNYMALSPDYIGYKDGAKNRDPELAKILLDDTETFQGSCYFMRRDFFNKLGLLDDKNFSGSGNEATEIGFKVRHAGGRVIRNKTTWYAHARLGRRFSADRTKSRDYIVKLGEEYGYKSK